MRDRGVGHAWADIDLEGTLKQQRGRCAICDHTLTSSKFRAVGRRLARDHCHRTGKARGLLCNSCNHLLGAAQDNESILFSAVAYLRYHSGIPKLTSTPGRGLRDSKNNFFSPDSEFGDDS